jgi:cytochrome c553
VHDPDLARGAVIAAQGNGAGAPACALCHGYNGISDGSGAFPRIAGQSPYYLSKQLYAFRTGVRKNAIMSPIASRLGAADIADVSAHYAAAVAPFMPLAAGDAALVKRGEQLANAGRAAVIGTAAEHNPAALGMPACSVCHGADGGGQSPTIPYLKGQYAQYLSFELRMWKLGFRRTSTDAMALIAPQLNERDIAALAAYYQQLATQTPPAQLPPAQAPAAQQRRAQLPPTQALAATASRSDR